MNSSSFAHECAEQSEAGSAPVAPTLSELENRAADVARALASPARLARLRERAVFDSPSEESFDRLTRLAARLLDVPIALLSLVTDELQFVKSCVGLGEPRAAQRGTPLSHSLCQHVVAAHRPLIIDDAPAEPAWRDHPAVVELGIVAYLGVPLITPDGLVLGSFCAIDMRPRAWDEAAIASMRDLAAVAMSEFALRVAAVGLEQERASLREERDRARMIMELVSQGLTITDEAGHLVYVNPAFARMVGREASTLLGTTLDLLLAPDSESTRRARPALPRVSRFGTIPIVDLQLQHSDGELIEAQVTSVPLTAEGGQQEILSSISDLTEAKAIEVELRRERDFTAAILETAGSLVVVLDRADRILRFNRACELLTGCSFAQVAGRPLDRVLSAAEAAPFVATWELLRAGLPPVSFEHTWNSVGGESACIDWTISAILDDHGQPAYVVGVGIDVTDRKRAEQQRAVEHDVVSILAAATSPSEVAPAFLEAICTHLDLSVGELWLPTACGTALERAARWALAHERDRALAERTATMTFALGEGLPGRVWASGEPIWWLPTEAMTTELRAQTVAAGIAGGMAFPIASGQATLGVLVLLSEEARSSDDDLRASLLAIGRQFGQFLEQRRAEAALHRAHQRLDLQIQNAPLSIIEWGVDRQIQRWSAEAERLFGWSAGEAIGKYLGDWSFIHVDDNPEVALLFDDLLSGRVNRNMHLHRNYTKAGGVVHVEWHNAVLRDPDGQIVSVMSLGLDITERVVLQARLAHQASHDPLTGLPNRALLLERLGQEVARAGRLGATVAVLFLDLDGFKAVNDSLGHAAGDELLLAITARLQAHVRADDTVARFGGDEFVAILAAPTTPHEAIMVAERLRVAVAQPIPLVAGGASVGTSIGIALSSPDHAHPEALLAAADAAMYLAKQRGKGGYALATAHASIGA